MRKPTAAKNQKWSRDGRQMGVDASGPIPAMDVLTGPSGERLLGVKAIASGGGGGSSQHVCALMADTGVKALIPIGRPFLDYVLSALADAGLAPLVLGSKEGLALINGTQATTGVGILSLLAAERALETAEVAGAMSLEALLGTPEAFRAEIQEALDTLLGSF